MTRFSGMYICTSRSYRGTATMPFCDMIAAHANRRAPHLAVRVEGRVLLLRHAEHDAVVAGTIVGGGSVERAPMSDQPGGIPASVRAGEGVKHPFLAVLLDLIDHAALASGVTPRRSYAVEMISAQQHI